MAEPIDARWHRLTSSTADERGNFVGKREICTVRAIVDGREVRRHRKDCSSRLLSS